MKNKPTWEFFLAAQAVGCCKFNLEFNSHPRVIPNQFNFCSPRKHAEKETWEISVPQLKVHASSYENV